MSNIKDFTEQQLREELSARIEAKEKAAEEARIQRLETFIAILSPKIIDALTPTHDRTSCSDRDVSNGIGSYRCNRCCLLDLIQHPYSNNFTFELQIRRFIESSKNTVLGNI